MALRESARLAIFLISAAIVLNSCKPPEQPAVISIVGAVLIDGAGGPPVSNSVITIENGRIRAVGSRVNLLVPAEAEKIDGSGKFLVPAPIDVARAGGYTLVHPGDPDGAFDKARTEHTPLFADIFRLRDARTMASRGVTGFLHTVRDTEALDPAFISQMRDLRIVFVPMLAEEHDPAVLAIAQHNTKRLADGGAPIGVGSTGDQNREMEMLAAAGLTPLDVLSAATRNGAAALDELDRRGTLEPGKRADLLLLSANPADDIRNMRKAERTMRDGQWAGK